MEYRLLDDAFFEPYAVKGFPAHMNEMAKFVYYRTYSRWLPELGRREAWAETVRRAVEYNCSLVPNVSADEAQALFVNIFNLKQFLSGRTFWVGGTPVAWKYPMSNFNCAFRVIDGLEAFTDLFYLLMIGTGVGFRVLERDVAQLPAFRTNVELESKYDPNTYHMIQANLADPLERSVTLRIEESLVIKVGDSKEGWVDALRIYLDEMTAGTAKKLYIDFSYVRPKGERLKQFGGTASGHESLKVMFEKIHSVITGGRANTHAYVELAPIDALDIANIVGENVVVGGVR